MFHTIVSLSRHVAIVPLQARRTLLPLSSNVIRFNSSKGQKDTTSPVSNEKTEAPTEGEDDKPKVKKSKKQLYMESQAARSDRNFYDKFLKQKAKKQNIKVYEVHDGMSVVQLAKVLKTSKDQLLDVVLGLPGCQINSDREPIGNLDVLREIAKILRCKFKYVPRPDVRRAVKEEKSLDVVHEPVKLEDLVTRPPVVTIVGHIDHGKTTLLDYLRKSSVVETEHGRITQHIGAFSVSLNNFITKSDQDLSHVTFLDTPGHAAFKQMRVRGASVTDIVILVVDAVEGPKEQTLESISAVNKAHVSMIVAINKIDRDGADVEGTKKALYDAGVKLEDYGGDVQAIPISALHGTNVQDLIEAVVAQAEILQLSCDPKGPVEATVIESKMEHGLGKVATVLVRRGTLKKGEVLVCGETFCKVRLLLDTRQPLGSDEEHDRLVLPQVLPSEACRLVGWKDLPHVGAEVQQVESEKRAHEVIRWRQQKHRESDQDDIAKEIEAKRSAARAAYEEYREKKLKANVMKPVYGRHDFYSREKEIVAPKFDEEHRVSILVKADVDGSLEAINNVLDTYDNTGVEVQLDVLRSGVGEITENDIKLCQDFGGILYAYNVDVSDNTRKMLSFYNVPVKEHKIIYALVHDLQEEINRRLPMKDVEEVVGRGVVLQEFTIEEKRKKVPVAGCKVNSGSFEMAHRFKITRDKAVIFDGTLTSMKHLKEEKKTIQHGQECGIRPSDSTISFQNGDVVVCYKMVKEAQFTDWSPPGF